MTEGRTTERQAVATGAGGSVARPVPGAIRVILGLGFKSLPGMTTISCGLCTGSHKLTYVPPGGQRKISLI